MKKTTVLKWACLALVLFFCACSSLPLPENDKDSLFVVLSGKAGEMKGLIPLGNINTITFSGPENFSFKISVNEEIVLKKKITAGEYTISFDKEIDKSPFSKTITIDAGSVTLFQFHFLADKESVYTKYVSNIERKKVLTKLSDYIGFESWYGFTLVGFEKLKPKMYLGNRTHKLTITGTPADASVFIDGDSWGVLPLVEEFAEAKYTIEIKKAGFQEVRKLIALDKHVTLDIALKSVETGATPIPAAQADFRIIVFPFQSTNNTAENPYGNLFPGSFAVTFRNNSRIGLIYLQSGVEVKAQIQPDFMIAEENGADLVITGEYYYEGDKLYIHPVLWDVKSERIKYTNTYISTAGFSVFNSIDTMAEEFSREVARVLPDAGEAIVEKEDIVTEGMLNYEKQLFADNLYTARIANRHNFMITIGMGGSMDTVWFYDGIGMEEAQLHNGLGALPRIGYSYMFSKDIGISLNVMGTWGWLHSNSSSADFPDPFFEGYLFGGIMFVFPAQTADLYFILGPSAGFISSVNYFDTALIPRFFDAVVYAGLNLEIGYRLYFQEKVNQKPFYFAVGIMTDVIQGQFGGINGAKFVPLQLNVFLGGGKVF